MITLLRRLGPPLILLLLLAGAFGPAILEGRLLAPGDGLAQYFPQRVAAAAAWRAGEVPFWNPYVFGGMPLMAAFQAGVFFPPNWLFVVLPPVVAMNAAVALAYATAGIAMFAYARAIALPPIAALLAAAVFAGGGFMVGHLEHLAVVQTAGLLPTLLWAIERFRQTLHGRYAIGAALGLAGMLFAGHPQTAVLGVGLAALYALFRAGGLAGKAGTYMAQLALALGLGLGLALMQLLPGLDLAGESGRAKLGYDAIVETSLSPGELVTLLVPFFYGAPPSAWFPTPYWGAAVWPNEVAGYAGLAALVLALVAVLATFFRERQVRFWSVVAVAALLLALGKHTPIYQLWAQLPVLSAIRVPARHLMELNLAIAVLAGLGLRAMLEPGAGRRAALFAWGLVGAGVLAIVAAVAAQGPTLAARLQPLMPGHLDMASALSFAQPAFWVPVVLWLAMGAALAVWGHGRVRTGLAALVAIALIDLFTFAQHQGWRQLAPQAGVVAAPEVADAAARTISVSAGPYPYHDAPLVAALRHPLAGALWGVRSIGGYEPLLSARYAKLVGGMTHGGVLQRGDVWAHEHRAIDLLGGRWLRLDATLADSDAWRSRLAGHRWKLVAKESRVWVYENRRALPRAWRPAVARALPAGEVDRRVLGEGRFDPRHEALLEGGPAAPASRGPVVAEAISPNHMRLTTAGAGPGLVVVSEGYDPGWRAYAGRTELPVRRADGLLLGVEAPAGQAEIELWYEPRRWRWGLLGTLLSALLLAFWWASCGRRPDAEA